MKKIPIVYILDNFYKGGGTENQLAILIDNLNRDIFEPSVLNLRPKLPEYSIDVDCEITYLDLERPFSLKGIKTIFRVSKYLKEKRARIIQVFFFDSRIIGTLAGKLAGIEKIIFSRRDFGWWHSPKKLFIARRLAAMSDNCIVNANAIKKLVVDNERFPEENIETIYNGVDLKNRVETENISRADLNLPDDVPVIGMIANLRPVKRIDRFISAAAKMENKHVHFVMVGTGDIKDALEKQVADNGLTDRFHFYYTVSGVPDLLKIFDIGALTSESEGLSNVLIEYALGGLPAVAYDTGGNSEIVIDNETGYIVPNGDIDIFAQKLDYLVQNKDLSKQFGEKAAQIAEKRYDIDKMVERAEKYYLKILGENN